MTPWTAAHQAHLSSTYLSLMPSNHLILCCLLLWSSTFLSIRVFPSESPLRITWPKDWNLKFSINPSNEDSGLISFRMVGSPCSARDSQESSPAPQFESFNFLALSLPYGPALTSTRDYRENHSFDYADLCQQSDVSAF